MHHIAVLGGGLTGLSSAFHLSRRFPEALVTVLEKTSRLGGWVDSERARVTDQHGTPVDIVLEAGPRTLRPNAKSVLELIHLLGLEKSVITVPKTAPAAKNRYLHLPGTSGILPIPTSILSVLSSPLRSIMLPAVLREPFRRANRPPNSRDESLDSFMTRRFGESFARSFGSALVHGIYAADSRSLSVRAAFPSLWDAEERGRGSVARGFLKSSKVASKNDYALGGTLEMMKDVSVYSFLDGMETLTKALTKYLKQNPKIHIISEADVQSLDITEEKKIEIKTSGQSLNPTHVVSTLPLPKLHALLPAGRPLPHLTANPSSSVTVLNLVYRTTPENQIHPQGFGYLIPRPIDGYTSPANPGILGTVFDSCAVSAQDQPTEAASHLTKITVMLGGPHKMAKEQFSVEDTLKHISSHLAPWNQDKNALMEPLFTRVMHHQNCIPVPAPGHLDRMAELRSALETGVWQGKLEVIGAGVGGVSVGDCVEAGKRAGQTWQ